MNLWSLTATDDAQPRAANSDFGVAGDAFHQRRRPTCNLTRAWNTAIVEVGRSQIQAMQAKANTVELLQNGDHRIVSGPCGRISARRFLTARLIGDLCPLVFH